MVIDVEARRAELVVGKRVGVWYPPPATSGRGVIVELYRGGGRGF